MKINHFIKYPPVFSFLSPQGHNTDTWNSYDGSWDIQTLNKWAFSTLTAAFLSTFEFWRKKRCTTMILLSKPLLTLDHMREVQSERKTPSVSFIKKWNKTIDKPTQQGITFWKLSCHLATCEDTLLHIFSSLKTVVLSSHPPHYFYVFMQNGNWHELQPRNYTVSITRAA